MKLIVLTYHFPPDPSMGAKRWAGLSKYLARSGAEIHVVASGPSDSTELAADGVWVHRVARRRTLNDLYRSTFNRRQWGGPPPRDETAATGADSGAGGESDGGSEPGGGLRESLRQELSLLLSFPDKSRGWAAKALVATGRIAGKGGVTAVISSGPPHLAHVVGAFAGSWYGIPHVVDLRDPWATYRSDLRVWPGLHTSRVGRFALPKMERFALSRSSLTIANTRRLRDLLRAHYPRERIEWVPNGVDLEEVSDPGVVEPYPGLSLSYTGTLYAGRTLDAVMEALAAFLERHPEARESGSRLRVAGRMEGAHAEEFRSRRRQLGLEEVVEHLGVVPHARAGELARASSLSLVLAQGQHLQVPGKIYELAAMGCPMLVISEPDSASADEAERLGVRLAPDDPTSLLRVLEGVWSGDEGARGDGNPLLGYQAIGADVEDLILQVGRGGSRRSG